MLSPRKEKLQNPPLEINIVINDICLSSYHFSFIYSHHTPSALLACSVLPTKP